VPHSPADIIAHMHHVAGQPDHAAKKEALFDTIHNMIVESVVECKSLGATDAMMVPFTETIAHFESMRSQLVAIDLT